jgi:hypothetical protein
MGPSGGTTKNPHDPAKFSCDVAERGIFQVAEQPWREPGKFTFRSKKTSENIGVNVQDYLEFPQLSW